MNRIITRAALAATVAGAVVAQALAQTPPATPARPAPLSDLVGVRQADQTTSGADAQHSHWIKLDQFIRPERMTPALFQQRWTLSLPNKQVAGLSFAGGPTAAAGIGETIGYVGGSGHNIAAMDTDTGKLFWQRTFDAPPAAQTMACPGSTAVSVTRAASLTPPVVNPVNERPVAPPFGGAVGAPGEGLPQAFVDANRTNPRPVQIVDPNAPPAAPAAGRGGGAGAAPAAAGAGRGGAAAGAAPAAGAPAAAAAGGRAGAAPAAGAAAPAAAAGGGGRGGGAAVNANYTYAISNDGVMHYLGTESGKDIVEPAPFLPAGSQPTDLIAISAGGVATLYAATVNTCGGTPNALYAFNLGTKAVTSYKTGGGNPAGAPSFAADGTAYLAIGAGSGGVANAIVALDPITLAVKSTFSQPSADFVASPTIFTSGGKTIVADITRDGRVFLLDAANLAGPPISISAAPPRSGFVPGGLASWEDDSGQRWVLAPRATSVVAYKVAAGGTALTEGYVISGLTAPLVPWIVSGVVFIPSSGQYIPAAGTTATAAQMAANGKPGKVFAVDGKTGAALWNTGTAIKSWIPNRGFWTTVGNFEVNTYDNKIMQFGMNMYRYAP